MKIALAIVGAFLGVCAAAGAICFANYAKSTDKPTIDGFFTEVKKACTKIPTAVDGCSEEF